ncbi:hypothetical protein FKM82_001497 [Ascaphus truei]
MVTMDNAEENAGPKGLQLIGRLPATQCPQVGNTLIGLSPEHQEVILKCLKSRKAEIAEALVGKVCAMSSAYLQDFDWQLKLGLSSDKLSTLQMPLVNLDLDITQNGDIKPVSIEMNKEELQNLINSLEAANKVVLQLK